MNPMARVAKRMKCTTSSVTSWSKAYNELEKKLKNITQLKRIDSMLCYDEQVYMPRSSNSSGTNTAMINNERSKQIKALAGIIHEKSTDPYIGELLNDLLSSPYYQSHDITELQRRVLQITKQEYDINTYVPTELTKKVALLASEASAIWKKSCRYNDFTIFQPILQQCIQVSKDIAQAKLLASSTHSSNMSLYSQILQEYEPGITVQRIDQIFHEIQVALLPLIKNNQAIHSSLPSRPSKSAHNNNSILLNHKISVQKQKKVTKKIIEALGYNENFGRFDISSYPLTMSFSPYDVRITSYFDTNYWFMGLSAAIHEAGHAMYDQHLGNSALPIDEALSMGTHESQSIFWEKNIGLSKSFWKWATPILNENFDSSFHYTHEQLYSAVNQIKNPSPLLWDEADELSYPLHIILRYRIEKDIFDGELDVYDIPIRWKEEMKQLLNLDVYDDTNGCLQNGHWSMLAFGYFPSYLIGAVVAAQLEYYCKQDVNNFEEKIEIGNFKDILLWMNDKIYRHGKRYTSLDEMLEAQLGEPLNPKYYIQYLIEKYT